MRSNHSALYLLVPALLLASCGAPTEKPKASIQSFPVIAVAAQDITGYQEFPTNIQGSNNNDVRAKISGYIQEVYVDEGQYVSKGQALFKLETNNLSQTANAAQAGVTASEANVAAAQAAVNAAQVEVDKLVPLVAKNIISNVQLETAKANLQRAKSQLGQAKADYAQAKANFQGAVANVDYSIIRSPVSGVVGRLPLKVGSLVGPGDATPITTVSDVKQLYAYFSMNEAEYLDFIQETPGNNIKDKLKNAPPVTLILANGEEYSEKGKIQTVTGQIDPSTGTIQFRVFFNNKDGLLTNGNSGVVHIPTHYNDALVVPQTAVFEQQGINYLYALDAKDTVRSKIVKLKTKFDKIAIVDSGIAAGDHIVVDGVGNIRSGTPIKPVVISIDSVIHSLKPIFE
jgi:membrane fusion protein (multidrug efflux system)